MIGAIAFAAALAGQPAVYRIDQSGRRIAVTDAAEIAYPDVIELSLDQAQNLSAPRLADILLDGREHEPIVQKHILVGSWGEFVHVRLTSASKPDALGNCTRTTFTIIMDNDREVPRAQRRKVDQYIQPSTACGTNANWVRVGPALGLERGAELVAKLSSLQEAQRLGTSSVDVECEERTHNMLCAGDHGDVFAALDLSRLTLVDAPTPRNACYRAELPATNVSNWWLAYCSEEEDGRIKMIHSPIAPPAPPPAPPRRRQSR